MKNSEMAHRRNYSRRLAFSGTDDCTAIYPLSVADEDKESSGN